MSFRSLLDHWQQTAAPTLTAAEYAVRLPVDDAARLQALAELYPGITKEQIVTRPVVRGATRAGGRSMPYVRGTKVISKDEQGDPIYEDAGSTPRFIELTRKHRKNWPARPRIERLSDRSSRLLVLFLAQHRFWR